MGSKGAGKQVVTQELDKQTQAQKKEAWDRARQVSNQSYTPYPGQQVAETNGYIGDAGIGMHRAGDQMGGVYSGAMGHSLGDRQFGSGLGYDDGFNTNPYSRAGAVGARALSGDQSATDQLMNPYMSNVIDALGTEYDRARGKSIMDVNDIATKGGAFGGDRQALLQGERLGAIDRSQMSDVANLLHGGFNDAMGRAQGAAGLGLNAGAMDNQFALGVGGQRLQGQQLGADYAAQQGQQRLAGLGLAQGAAQGQLGAAQAQLGMGDYLRNMRQQGLDAQQQQFNEQRDWGLRGLNVLNSTMSGQPYGSSTSQPLSRNLGAGILGGAATGAQIGKFGGPVGTAVGAGVGGLLGLFG